MTDPSRDLPRVINTAMCVAISGLALMNVALFVVISFRIMRERSVVAVVGSLDRSDTAILTHYPGIWPASPSGGTVYALVVSASCLGSLNANVFTSGRVIVAASKNHYFPKIFGNDHCSQKEKRLLL